MILRQSHLTQRALPAEEQDAGARPELSTHIENPDQYDTIILGYPNWWGDMPQALYTFLEEYDFSGKTIIPFATSGGSGMEQVSSHLAPSCVGAKLLLGKVFPSSVTKEETNTWFSKLQARLE